MTPTLAPETAAFARLLEAAAGGPPRLAARRREAAARFLETGLPSAREEAWRTFDVRPLARPAWSVPAAAGDVEDTAGALPDEAARLVFVDGRWVPEASRTDGLPDGVVVAPFSRAWADGEGGSLDDALAAAPDDAEAFEALNTALFADGAWIHVGPGVVLDHPVHLVFLGGPERDGASLVLPRVAIRLEAGARCAVLETHRAVGGAAALRCPVVDCDLGPGARLDHGKVLDEGEGSWHLGTLRANVGRDADLATFSLTMGDGRSRHEARAVLTDVGAAVTMDGVYAIAGGQHVDHATLIDHAAPHGASRELFKGILDQRATSAFAGRIVVRPGAQQTSSRQANHNLLLSDHAVANSKPELEIFADDVKCAHGATVGQLDREAIFYLRSRGLSERDARSMLVRAFAGEVPARIRHAALRTHVEATLERRLGDMLT